MDIGKQIIARVLEDGDASQFLKAGYDLKWLDRDESAAIFDGQSVHGWRFILRHQDKHGIVPAMELFRREIPEGGFRLPKEPLQVSELIELVQIETRRVTIQMAQVAIQDVFARDDFVQGDKESIDQAEAILRHASERLSNSAASGSKYRTATLDELMDLPEPESLIEGALDVGTVVMLSGPSGSGKSFTALDWALCIARGRDWLGRPVRQGSVIYVAAEGYVSLGHRGKAWRREFGKVPKENMLFVTEPVQLDDEGTAYLTDLIREREADLLIIDTLARCTVGMEENSAKEMGLVIDRLYKMRDSIEECGTTILPLHHSGYEGTRARGSSAMKGGFDGMWDIQGKDPDPNDGVTLRCSKRKDGEAFRSISVKLRPAGTSMVLEEIENSDLDGPRAGLKNAAETDVENSLQDDIGQSVKELAATTGKPAQTVDRHLTRLEKDGRARREHDGKKYLWYAA